MNKFLYDKKIIYSILLLNLLFILFLFPLKTFATTNVDLEKFYNASEGAPDFAHNIYNINRNKSGTVNNFLPKRGAVIDQGADINVKIPAYKAYVYRVSDGYFNQIHFDHNKYRIFLDGTPLINRTNAPYNVATETVGPIDYTIDHIINSSLLSVGAHNIRIVLIGQMDDRKDDKSGITYNWDTCTDYLAAVNNGYCTSMPTYSTYEVIAVMNIPITIGAVLQTPPNITSIDKFCAGNSLPNNTITFTDNSTDETGFNIYRKTTSFTTNNPSTETGVEWVGSYFLSNKTGTGDAISRTDTTPVSGTGYVYRVEAVTGTAITHLGNPFYMYLEGDKTANCGPRADGATITTNEDTAVGITLTGQDIEGKPLIFTKMSNPANGTLTGTIPNLIYTPNANYNNTPDTPDTFTFTVTDSTGAVSDPATISITVNPINDSPILNTIGNKTTDENSLLTFTVSGSDVENAGLTYSASNLPAGVSFDPATKIFSWTPDFTQGNNKPTVYPNIVFSVNDGSLSASETITITVNNVNRAPAANGQSKSVNGNSNDNIISLSGTDPDGDFINSCSIVSGPTHGSFGIPQNTGCAQFYTPKNGFTGSDSFTFTVSDETLSSTPATVNITVTSPSTPILNITGSGSGNGTITSSPAGINCTITNGVLSLTGCSSEFHKDELVTLTASVSGDNKFIAWNNGGCSGTETSCSIKMDITKTVDAKFYLPTITLAPSQGYVYPNFSSQQFNLTTDEDGSGKDKNPNMVYIGPTDLKLSSTGSTVAKFNNSYTGASDIKLFGKSFSPGTVTLSAQYIGLNKYLNNLTATTQLTVHPNPRLTINTTGTGIGVVKGTYVVDGTQAGIQCGSGFNACANSYTYGTVIRLTANPDENSIFAGWSGDCNGTSFFDVSMTSAGGDHENTPNANKNCTATFNSIGSYSVEIRGAGTGGGSVTGGLASYDTDINCAISAGIASENCIKSFQRNKKITLVHKNNNNSSFAGWSGIACDEENQLSNCTFTLDSNKIITAEFNILTPAANTPPVATNQSVSTTENTAKTITLTATDADNDSLTFKTNLTNPADASLVAPLHGALSNASGANITYTPNSGYTGADSFTFKANDGKNDSNAATVSVTVQNTSTCNPKDNSPTIPSNPNPANGATGVFTSEVSWQASTDADILCNGITDGITYDVSLDTSNPPTTNIASNISQTVVSGLNLLENTVYYWQVNAKDKGGNITKGPIWSFTTRPKTEFNFNISPLGVNESINPGDSQTYLLTLQTNTPNNWSVVSLSFFNPSILPAVYSNWKVGFSYYSNNNCQFNNLIAIDIFLNDTNDHYVCFTVKSDPSITSENDRGNFYSFDIKGTSGNTSHFAKANLYVNQRPVAIVNANPASGLSPLDVTFKDGGSYDPDASKLGVSEGKNVIVYAIDYDINDGNNSADACFSNIDSICGQIPPLVSTPAELFSGWTHTYTKNTTARYCVFDDMIPNNTEDFSKSIGCTEVNISITGANNLPVASDQSVSTTKNTVKTITLTATDADNDPLTFKTNLTNPADASLTAPLHGTLSNASGANITYTPNSGYSGTDSFTFKANDGKADSNVATVSINIGLSNSAPIAEASVIVNGGRFSYNTPLTVVQGESVTFTSFEADHDVNGDNKASYDPDGWTTANTGVSSGGKCEWDKNINGSYDTPAISNPLSPADCNVITTTSHTFNTLTNLNTNPNGDPYTILKITDAGGLSGESAIRVKVLPVNPNEYNLLVAKSGLGDGTFKTSDGKINCGIGVECLSNSASYTKNSNTTIIATPDANSVFAGWNVISDPVDILDDTLCPGLNTSCTLNINSNKTVVAVFDTISGNSAPSPVVGISLNPADGFNSKISVNQGEQTTFYLAAWQGNENSPSAKSDDPDGWTDASFGMSSGSAKCDWDTRLVQNPANFISQTARNAPMTDFAECSDPNKDSKNYLEITTTFNDNPGTYTYYVLKMTDAGGLSSRVADTAVSVTVAPCSGCQNKPDLIISNGPDTASGNLIEGETITFKGTVKNNGNEKAGGKFINRFKININNDSDTSNDQTLPDNPSITNLDSGSEEQVISGSWTAIKGTHRIILCADDDKNVDESDENNNCSFKTGDTGNIGVFTVDPKTPPCTNLCTNDTCTITGPTGQYERCVDTNGDGCKELDTTPINCASGLSCITGGNGAECVSLPEIDFTANPTEVKKGDPSTLSWKVTNADSCTASANPPSSAQWSGSITKFNSSKAVNPAETTTYTLTCEKGGNSVSKDQTIRIISGPGPIEGYNNINSDIKKILARFF